MSSPKLLLGNKNYSSWSLRAWIVMAKSGMEFEEVVIPLFEDDFKKKLLKISPAGQVPILQVTEDLTLWDSLAIAEYVAEQHPQLWPKDTAKRAEARVVSAEMHSGFTVVRNDMPMNCRATGRKVEMTKELTADVERIQAIWTTCRNKYASEGPWLFGEWSIADAMYAPVAFRFRTYGVTCDEVGKAYMETVLNDPDMKRWMEAAKNEKQTIERSEAGK